MWSHYFSISDRSAKRDNYSKFGALDLNCRFTQILFIQPSTNLDFVLRTDPNSGLVLTFVSSLAIEHIFDSNSLRPSVRNVRIYCLLVIRLSTGTVAVAS